VKTLRHYVTAFFFSVLVIVAGGLALAAFWEGGTPFSRQPATSFPTRTAQTMQRAIQQALTQHGIPAAALQASGATTIQQGKRSWILAEYTIPLDAAGNFATLLTELTAAVEAVGGEILQTYAQPERQQTTVTVGIGPCITHRLVFRWQAPVVVAAPTPPPTNILRAVIVIDDLGANMHTITRLLALNEELTFSILPHLAHSTDIATLLHRHQKEVLLHLPMEPEDFPATSPGKGALLMRMTAPEIQAAIQANLRSVPFAVGVNNHMGSALTANRAHMTAVLQQLQQQQLFFLDSRTTAKSVSYQLAQELGVKSAERQVFLDVQPSVAFAKQQLRALADLAEQRQPAIAIGHPKEATLRALKEMLPEFQQRNIQIVPLSQLIH